MPTWEFKCSGKVFEWRGPAPFYFVKVDSRTSEFIRERGKNLSYGWGVIYIHGRVKGHDFQTAIIPKDGAYLIPLKDSVRKASDIQLDDKVQIEFNLGKVTV